MLASYAGHDEVVQLLIIARAQLDMKDADARTALIMTVTTKWHGSSSLPRRSEYCRPGWVDGADEGQLCWLPRGGAAPRYRIWS
mmetsp:Transcript_18147/g.28156  ORF Transcript_18147/g.28156 Transcript_18147/m.28156 type:complete len:84 (-) Transcript_18147:583-834(-)